MNRNTFLASINENQEKVWDVIIIGGGSTGLGAALDGASRGLSVLLLEQADFAKGTSSRSTKLVHGGVRYLAQGDVGLVREALRERGLLQKNAPHLVKNETFVIPNYSWFDKYFYVIGLTVYDLLAGKLSLGRSKGISKKETIKRLPTIKQDGLRGGVIYHDGQFDDSRLALNTAQTASEEGGVVLNYMEVKELLKENGAVSGVKAYDHEKEKSYIFKSKTVVNATGVFVDEIMKMDRPNHEEMVRPSQGIHLVLDRKFLPSDDAIMIPKTSDGRVLFAVPWHDKIVVGTTDTLLDEKSLEPTALEKEIDFVLETAKQYLTEAPTRKDVKSVYAGLRPLAKPKEGSSKTKEISRSHKILVSDTGLITVTGGKWTTYRRMGEDTIDKVVELGKLDAGESRSADITIHGGDKTHGFDDPKYFYGSDKEKVLKLAEENPEWGEKIHPDYEFIKAEAVWAARNEMALRVEDFLARRIRILFLDARAAIDMAPIVAELMAQELGKDSKWVKNQIEAFTELGNRYLLERYEPKIKVN